MGSRGSQHEIGALRARLEAEGQEHVLRFWHRLDAASRAALAAQLGRYDLPSLRAALAACDDAAATPPRKLSALPVERVPARGGDARRWEAARRHGEELLAEGRVACLVVAGGQGTRLGHPGPKGLFAIGPITRRTLFEVQAQKLRRLRARCGAAVPWYVMTSPATDAATRRYFESEAWFGLPPEDVRCFVQGMVPSFDLAGRLLLAEPGRVAENPDGHGGCLTALLASGALDDLERRGITSLFYCQIDNPLVRLADAAFLGFHALAGAEVSCKVVAKTDPMERVGVVAIADGRPAVVEYTELDDDQRFARDADGRLVHWAGSIAIHVFEVAFVRRIAEQAERWLPFHASTKKIPCVDAEGRAVAPDAPNGRKLERFVFDALPAAGRVCVVEAERALEFSPVKNARGTDSPESVRRDLCAQYRAWLEAAGLHPPAGAVLEIDHARIDAPEDIRAAGIASLAAAGDAVRIQPGALG